MPDLTTRVGNSHVLILIDNARSHDGDTLEAQIGSWYDDVVILGTAQGQPAGQDTTINLSFDAVVPRRTYQLKVCGPDGIIYPKDGSEYTIEVLEGC